MGAHPYSNVSTCLHNVSSVHDIGLKEIICRFGSMHSPTRQKLRFWCLTCCRALFIDKYIINTIIRYLCWSTKNKVTNILPQYSKKNFFEFFVYLAENFKKHYICQSYPDKIFLPEKIFWTLFPGFTKCCTRPRVWLVDSTWFLAGLDYLVFWHFLFTNNG